MPFALLQNFTRQPLALPASLEVSGRQVRVVWVRHPRARRYVLRLHPDGSARVTIPRGGSPAEAFRFATKNRDWLARALHRQAARPGTPAQWTIGTELFFRGEPQRIVPGPDDNPARVRLGPEVIKVAALSGDLRPAIEKHLRRLATRELPGRVTLFAQQHQLSFQRVSVRNQRSRWGSCSRRGTISLNWRLIQTPVAVQDYIILHELMHLRQMNHSARFWQEVQKVCPDYEVAEHWLKQHATLLR